MDNMTQKQFDFITSLCNRKDLAGLSAKQQEYVAQVQESEVFPTKEVASRMISQLLDLADKPQPKRPIVEPGMYRLEGDVYKVQIAVHGSQRPYAKRLVVDEDSVHFEYAAGAVSRLSAEDRMTLEEAKEFGHLYGTCCVCGKTLTNESSIENGIGPVCAGKF